MNYSQVMSILGLNEKTLQDILGAFGDEVYKDENSEQLQCIQYVELDTDFFENYIEMTPERIEFFKNNSHFYLGNSFDVNSNPSGDSIINQDRYNLYEMKTVKSFRDGELVEKGDISKFTNIIGSVLDVGVVDNTGLGDTTVIISSGKKVVSENNLFAGTALSINEDLIFDFYYFVDRESECNYFVIESGYNTAVYKAVKIQEKILTACKH